MNEDAGNAIGWRLLNSWRHGSTSHLDELDEWESEAWPFHADAMELAANDAEAASYAWQRLYYYFLIAHDAWDDHGVAIVSDVVDVAKRSSRFGSFLCEWIIVEFAQNYPAEATLAVEALCRAFGWSFGSRLLRSRVDVVAEEARGGVSNNSLISGALDPRDIFWIYDPSVVPRRLSSKSMYSWRAAIANRMSPGQSIPAATSEVGVCDRDDVIQEGVHGSHLAIVAALDSGRAGLAAFDGVTSLLSTLVINDGPDQPIVLPKVVAKLLNDLQADRHVCESRARSPWESTFPWREGW
ncbi:hypothetical protein QE418_000374 [Microbacterium testaceum]|uniref:hypothetical protein n=1 Tax=Microbacterium TaxID=33882 RepID=UPI002781E8AA|nr:MULTISPECIES: hypothetical protein [Microbacterium]MDQ1110926.1 hypothetical protein [Microbacterium testaceum]MDR6098533.1 hypothetical protein [Microbacterium sp. SORGH_AS_0454]